MEMSDPEYVLSIAEQESTSSLENLWMIEKMDAVAMVYLPELICYDTDRFIIGFRPLLMREVRL